MRYYDDAFQKFFHRKCILYGEHYFRAPPSDIIEFAEHLSSISGNDLGEAFNATQNAHDINWQRLLPKSAVKHWHNYFKEAGSKAQFLEAPSLVANIVQTPAERINMMRYIPSFLTHTSTIVQIKALTESTTVSRPMVPKEKLHVMGHCVFEGSERSVLARCLKDIRPHDLETLAGNGFHVPKIGTALIYSLCNFKLRV